MTSLVFLDLDGTLTAVKSPWQHIHAELGLWEGQGLGHLQNWLAGRIDYQTFFDLDVAMWLGLPRTRLEGALDTIPILEQAGPFLRALEARGLPFVALSSGFTYMAERIARHCEVSFKRVFANEMLFDDRGCLKAVRLGVSGAPDAPEGKAGWVLRCCEALGVDPAEAAAVGDSAGDTPMFEQVGTSVALADEPVPGAGTRLPPGELMGALEVISRGRSVVGS